MTAARPGGGWGSWANWRRRLVATFTENLALKASAALLAVVLWFVVAAREPTEEVIGVRFEPLLDSSLVLRDPPPMVRALVIGRASEILKLSSNPLTIRRPIASDVPDTLVVSLRTSDVEVPEGIEVIVRDVEPRAIPLRFEASASRTVPVRSALYSGAQTGGRNAAVVEPASVRLEPESVTISGPRRAVSRIRFVRTAMDTIAPYDTLPHLVDLDTAQLGVSVKPPQVKATLIRENLRARASRTP
jgi:hypothetical protein